MKKVTLILSLLVWLSLMAGQNVLAGVRSYDIRGPWVGKAEGSIFGAEGSVNITHQVGERIRGIVEGGNFLGKAKFSIEGIIRGNQIYGEKEGHTFHGFLYPDGAIRGVFTASDGDKYRIFLRRAYPQPWGMPYQGTW